MIFLDHYDYDIFATLYNQDIMWLFGASRQSIHLQNYGPISEKLKYGDMGATVYGLNLVSACIRVNKQQV